MKAELNTILEPENDYEAIIFEAEKQMLLLRKPNIWNTNVEGNMEVETEVEFEKFLVSLGEHTNENLEEASVFKFYAIIDLLKERNSDGRSDN